MAQHHDHRHGHGHQHGRDEHHGHDHDDFDWNRLAPHLEAQAELFAPLYREVMDWLARDGAEPGLIVDAGSGPGVISGLFAEAFPGARVVAVDGAEPLLERAAARAARLGVGDRLSTLTGELPGVLGELEYPADLLWASNSLHHLGDQRAALAAFADSLAPGGTVAILESGLPARFLPRDLGFGRPGLQARIDGVESVWFSRMREELPGAVAEAEDWPALLAAAGLRHTGTRSFLRDVPAPLDADARAYVAGVLGRVRDAIGDGLDADDLATLDRLLDPDDEAGVHRRPDVFVLAAYTVHRAVKPR
ncbi:methyltransferase [Streptomyces sp. NPDC008150]|uniref:class I SAM-dependent methyltransferase n=1 Tax=Streptomyces sp. NPDC008150 TaxID=3364816 RepID=UPI0036E662D5